MEDRLRKSQFSQQTTTGKAILVNPDEEHSKEPSGEAESLRGRVNFRMGDRVGRSRPPVKQEEATYHPKTQQTTEVYQKFLSELSIYLGEQPAEVLKDVVDSVLQILKLEGVQDNVKHEKIQELLGRVELEDYSRMLAASKLLVDFTSIEAPSDESEVKIAVEIETAEPITDTLVNEIEELEEPEEIDRLVIDPKDIDGNWLWRKLSESLSPEEAESKTEAVLGILDIKDIRQCENKLVMTLGFDKFDLVTLLLNNRFNILMCTKFARDPKATSELLKNSEDGLKLMETLVPDAPAPKRTIDLKNSKFEMGNHIMSNSKVVLPPDSQRLSFPAYEQVTIPPSTSVKKTKLVKVEDLPSFFHPGFSTVRTFNPIQSTVLPTALGSDKPMLVCAPTGAGKTNIALMTILRLVHQHQREDGSVNLNSFKVVYVAPMKALVSEVCGSLSFRLQAYGLQVNELTGDSTLNKEQIKNTQVIITTPEKWDIITRKSDTIFTKMVKLLIIDEIHLLHDLRGPVLEAIISRTARLSLKMGQETRLVGLSATLPNYKDVGNLLSVPEDALYFFDRSWRPVPLQQQYIGITEKKASKRMVLINEILASKVEEQSSRANQILVFVHSRKDTARTAKFLMEKLSVLKEESQSRGLLAEYAQSVHNVDLRELLPNGFAIHHAGLSKDDRRLVEDLFGDRHVQVLVSTATLAWGVNLPAHSVIIKGTQVYSPEAGAWVEISPQDILQMIGRAGRMDFDTEGEGIIMTGQAQLPFYLSLLNTQLPIESQMMAQLSDHLNAEVVLSNVASISEAVEWFKTLYLYTRLVGNPSLYGYDSFIYKEIDGYILDLVHSAAMNLDRHGLIKYDKARGLLEGTALGQVASHYYIKPESLSAYNSNLQAHFGPIDLLRVFALSHEFKHIPVRAEEKVEVGKLMERVPFPVKGAQDQPTSKVNILLQAYISRLKLDGFTLMADMVYISASAGRIMRALFEICTRRSWAGLANLTLHFSKMIRHRMWGVMSPLRQLNALPESLLLRMEKTEGLAWEHYLCMTAQQLTDLLKDSGNQVYELIKKFPKVQLSTFIQPFTRSSLKIELAISKDFQWDRRFHGGAQLFWVFVEDVDNEILLYYQQFMLKQKYAEEEHIITFIVPLFEPVPPQYFIRVVSDTWIAAETLIPVSFRHLILPEKNLPPTPLEPIQVPIESLRWPAIENLIHEEFNEVECQVFTSVYCSDESVLVCSPYKTDLLQVLGGLRSMAKDGKILIVTPHKPRMHCLIRYWTPFLQVLNEGIGVLTQDIQLDAQIFMNCNVIIGTTENVEYITRRWRPRTYLHEIRTVICDQMHLLAEGMFETCLARMRWMFSELSIKARFLCFSHPLSTAKDVSDWMGVSLGHMYNFLPSVRSLDVVLQAFDQNDHVQRIQAMSAKAYSAIKAYDGPSIVFVADRKTAQLIAEDFLLYMQGDSQTRQFDVEAGEYSKFFRSGVGILHERSDENIIEIVKSLPLFTLICTSECSWGLDIDCSTGIILDTCKYEGSEHRYLDYPISQTISMAYYPKSTSLVLCHTSKKDYLKKFLSEPFPLESSLEQHFVDNFNTEIANRNISNKQEAVDWITWTFYYRRLLKNPNYYNLQGVSPSHINDHLSELVENTIEDLEKANCVQSAELDLARLNIGMIADHYNIKVNTINTFARSVTPNTKARGIIELISASTELESLPIRPGERLILSEINESLPEMLDSDRLNSPQKKSVLLLMAHFSRLPLTADLSIDQVWILQKALKLLHALVDTISTLGFLFPVIHTLNVCQMITQGMWDKDTPLLQLPHLNEEILEKCLKGQIEDVVDLVNMEDEDRSELLQGLTNTQIEDIARVCNAYPSINLEFQNPPQATTGEVVNVQVKLEREGEESDVYAPFFPDKKIEFWWIIIGYGNKLLALKKVTLHNAGEWTLNFVAPDPGIHEINVYLVTDSYVGVDQGEKFTLKVIN